MQHIFSGLRSYRVLASCAGALLTGSFGAGAQAASIDYEFVEYAVNSQVGGGISGHSGLPGQSEDRYSQDFGQYDADFTLQYSQSSSYGPAAFTEAQSSVSVHGLFGSGDRITGAGQTFIYGNALSRCDFIGGSYQCNQASFGIRAYTQMTANFVPQEDLRFDLVVALVDPIPHLSTDVEARFILLEQDASYVSPWRTLFDTNVGFNATGTLLAGHRYRLQIMAGEDVLGNALAGDYPYPTFHQVSHNGSNLWDFDMQMTAVVPTPAAAWLFGSALGVMGVMRRKLAG
jgi:hypothetical protein